MIRILAGLGGLATAVVGLVWLNYETIILALAAREKIGDIPPTQEIAWAQGPSAAPEGDRPPNIVFILADDLGINDISTYGGGMAGGTVPTPNIDRLRAGGVSFDVAYSGTASCAPSRGMLMTGRYPTRTGFEFTPTPGRMSSIVATIANRNRSGRPKIKVNPEGGQIPYEQQGLPGSEITIAEVLQDAGYHTVHIGKWHMGREGEFTPNNQGFDESLLMASGLYLPEDDRDVVNAKLDFDPIDRFLWAGMEYAAQYNDGEWFEPGGYLTDWWTDEAVEVIEANRNRPFFLYLAHWAVHTPLQATKEDYEALAHIESHRERVYAGMMLSLDRSVGRVLDALDAQGLTDNTIIVFSSDNGGAGYIGVPEVNHPYRGWKLTFFEGGIRVPMFMKWPSQIEAGTTVTAPVSHIDVMPTLAAAAGAPLPDIEIDGANLLPIARGETEERPHDAIFFQSAGYQVVRAEDWKLQLGARPGTVHLFNLADDPTEQVNLADQHPEKVASLTAMIEEHQANARPPLYPHQIEGVIAVDETINEPFDIGDDEFIIWPN
ncbi:MAG: sulfatase-like hydrolase/transferase [Pseudomonadota bacterium]